jgi:uncharacterized protein (DUF58 family)
MSFDPRELIDPAFFSRLESIELRARSIVEGSMHGLHRSPYLGMSVEFASHREYAPGDDLRHLNWKLYARHDRLYIKEYDADTNLNLYLLVDSSASMGCDNAGRSKLHYAASLAAALAHLALKQHDAVGLTLYADRVLAHLPPRSKPAQLDAVLASIADAEVRPAVGTDRALHEAAELATRRGLVVILSDLFGDLPAIVGGLDHLRYRNHEVLIFHVLDPYERDLSVDGNIRFRDLESGETLTTQAEGIRAAYRAAVDDWRQSLEFECRKRAIDRVELTTLDPPDRALLDYLVRRARTF